MFHKKTNRPALACIILALLLAVFHGSNGYAESQPFKRIVKERIVGSIDPSTTIPDSLAISPDGKRAAYVVKIGSKQAMVVDGLQQKAYDEIKIEYSGPAFSPDSRWIGYFAKEDNRWFFVNKEKEEKEHLPGINLSFDYSEEGLRYCYAAKIGKKHYLVIDGNAGSSLHDQIFYCKFSSDGRRVAYSAKDGEKVFFVVDGVKQKEYAVSSSFSFSPDGNRFAYKAYPEKGFSQRGQRWLMVIDGHVGKDYWKVHGSFNIFSPDSRRTAYYAEPGTTVTLKPVIVLDGQEITDERAGFSSPLFSPDSKRIAYMARTYKSPALTSYDFNVIDGQPGKTYDRVSIPVFSPDSRRFGYYGVVNDKYMMVIDNEEGRHYDHTGHPVFSKDSRHVGYDARQGKEAFIVVDGKEYSKYENVTKPVFSPDSQRAVFLAKQSGKQTVVVDAVEGLLYDAVYPKNWCSRVADRGIGFSSDQSFYYFARKGNELLFIQETIKMSD